VVVWHLRRVRCIKNTQKKEPKVHVVTLLAVRVLSTSPCLHLRILLRRHFTP